MDLELKQVEFDPWMALFRLSTICADTLHVSIASLLAANADYARHVIERCGGLTIVHADDYSTTYRYQSSNDGNIVEATLRFDYSCGAWELQLSLIDYAFNRIIGLGLSGGGGTKPDIGPLALIESTYTRKAVASFLPLIHALHPALADLKQYVFENFLAFHGFKRVFNYEWQIECTSLAANWCAAELQANDATLTNAHTFAEAWDYFNERLGQFRGDEAYTAMFEANEGFYLRAIVNELLNAYGLTAVRHDKGLMGLRGFLAAKCYDVMKELLIVGPSGKQLVYNANYKIASLHADFQANG